MPKRISGLKFNPMQGHHHHHIYKGRYDEIYTVVDHNHNTNFFKQTQQLVMTMECRNIRITVFSAQNLPDVRIFGRMKVYAKMSINDDPDTATQTAVDMEGETNPRWNSVSEYTITESCVQEPESVVAVRLYCERTLGDTYVAGVGIKIKALLDSGIKSGDVVTLNLPGTEDGKLNFSYSFSDIFLAPKPSSNWKKKAAAVMLRGTWFLLTGDIGSF